MTPLFGSPLSFYPLSPLFDGAVVDQNISEKQPTGQQSHEKHSVVQGKDSITPVKIDSGYSSSEDVLYETSNSSVSYFSNLTTSPLSISSNFTENLFMPILSSLFPPLDSSKDCGTTYLKPNRTISSARRRSREFIANSVNEPNHETVRQCAHCGTSESRVWRTIPDSYSPPVECYFAKMNSNQWQTPRNFWRLCNACGIYARSNKGASRPFSILDENGNNLVYKNISKKQRSMNSKYSR